MVKEDKYLFKFNCPNCKKPFSEPLEIFNGTLRCPSCGKDVIGNLNLTINENNSALFKLSETYFFTYLEKANEGKKAKEDNGNENKANIYKNKAVQYCKKAAFLGHPEAILKFAYYIYAGVANALMSSDLRKKIAGQYFNKVNSYLLFDKNKEFSESDLMSYNQILGKGNDTKSSTDETEKIESDAKLLKQHVQFYNRLFNETENETNNLDKNPMSIVDDFCQNTSAVFAIIKPDIRTPDLLKKVAVENKDIVIRYFINWTWKKECKDSACDFIGIINKSALSFDTNKKMKKVISLCIDRSKTGIFQKEVESLCAKDEEGIVLTKDDFKYFAIKKVNCIGEMIDIKNRLVYEKDK